MKTAILFVLLLATISLCAQNLTLGTGIERTVAATESQFTVGYLTKKQWSVGTFYQATLNVPPFENTSEGNSRTWYGAYLNLPLAKSEKIIFYTQVRAGLINKQFVAIVPSLETKITITRWFALGVGSSYRHGYPAFSFKAHIKLFNQTSI